MDSRSREHELVGREEELASVRSAYAESRIVTLLGPGGVGKTSLARALDADLFCDLSEATTALETCSVLADALELPLSGADEAEAITALAAQLTNSRTQLVVLDNFEQLVGVASTLVAALSENAPEVRWLITSRQRLHLRGERVIDLAPLLGDAAVELFSRRAREVRHAWEPDAGERDGIEAICRALDGLPLAIELAAARTRALSIGELRERLSESFEALGRGPRDAPVRHSTLSSTLDWSWKLLTAVERAALAQASVFEGGFDLDAAEAVLSLEGADVLDALASLVDKSLLRAALEHGRMRYRAFLTVRAYARERLAESELHDATLRRHSAYHLAVGIAWADAFEQRATDVERRRLDAERENLLAVHRRGLASSEHRTDAIDAALALQPMLITRGPAALRLRILDDAMRHNTDAVPLRLAWASLARGDTHARLGHFDAAHADLREALRHAEAMENSRIECVAHWRLGSVLAPTRLDDAERHFERAVALAREVSDAFHEGRILGTHAHALSRVRPGDARRLCDEAMDAHERSGDVVWRAATEGLFGILAHDEGRLDDAFDRLSGAIAQHRERSLGRWEALFLGQLGAIHLERGDASEARAVFEEALAAQRRYGDRFVEPMLQIGLATTYEIEADHVRAEQHFRATKHTRGDELFRFAGLAGRVRAACARDSIEDALALLTEPFPTEAAGFEALARAHVDLARGTITNASAVYSTHRSATLAWLRIAAQRLGDALSSVALTIGPDTAWFRAPGGERVDLARRAAPRRVLDFLVERGSARTSIEELFSAGWPGEKALPDAAASRVYVAISTLRKLGLQDVILRDDEGYGIDLPVIREHS